jgi:apolipoprotein N-acyltransferase
VVNNKKIGVSICFENLFDIGTLNRVGDGDTLISISNFAWFLVVSSGTTFADSPGAQLN